MSDQCWANVVDGRPTLVRHWVDVSCFLGIASRSTFTGCQNYQIRYQLMCQLLSSAICGLSDARCVSYSMTAASNPNPAAKSRVISLEPKSCVITRGLARYHCYYFWLLVGVLSIA